MGETIKTENVRGPWVQRMELLYFLNGWYVGLHKACLKLKN